MGIESSSIHSSRPCLTALPVYAALYCLAEYVFTRLNHPQDGADGRSTRTAAGSRAAINKPPEISQLRLAAHGVVDLNRFAIFRRWCCVGRHMATEYIYIMYPS